MQLPHGVTSIEDLCGTRTTHKGNPSFMLSLDADSFSETAGEVVAGALKWSGNYKIDFCRDETGRLQVNAGINPQNAEWHLGKGETNTQLPFSVKLESFSVVSQPSGQRPSGRLCVRHRGG